MLSKYLLIYIICTVPTFKEDLRHHIALGFQLFLFFCWKRYSLIEGLKCYNTLSKSFLAVVDIHMLDAYSDSEVSWNILNYTVGVILTPQEKKRMIVPLSFETIFSCCKCGYIKFNFKHSLNSATREDQLNHATVWGTIAI